MIPRDYVTHWRVHAPWVTSISCRNRSAPKLTASSGRETLMATWRWSLRSLGEVDDGHAAVAEHALSVFGKAS